ncbi:LTP_2 domain-containing protein [Cephalotus follicularis]|uniref:LTP_2 domain-containing protein n=1 Tax=Cephalotus follicularis TaxID=3775 RepID=A0A1Q3BVH6_CEPFO|nr:LTP_2 domain-containing protein [Cephalotus follicularis]
MAISKISMGFLVITVVSIWSSVVGVKDSQTAPSPPVDCTNLVLSMADCLTYVQNGSAVAKPEGSCCVGLKNVLMIEPECICEVFQNSATLGFVLNATKAETLPAVCKVSAISISDCGSSVPADSPGMAPIPIAGAPAVTVGANEGVPSSSGSGSPRGTSGSSSLTISLGSLVISLVVATFFSFSADGLPF